MLELLARQCRAANAPAGAAVRGRCRGALLSPRRRSARARPRAAGLLEDGPRVGGGTQTMGSLRTERVESAWLKLVNSIEKSGLSLVDTKDEALRQKLVAAGFTAPLCAARLHAGAAGAGARPAAARVPALLGRRLQPERAQALLLAGHRGRGGPLPAQPVRPRQGRPAPARHRSTAFPTRST